MAFKQQSDPQAAQAVVEAQQDAYIFQDKPERGLVLTLEKRPEFGVGHNEAFLFTGMVDGVKTVATIDKHRVSDTQRWDVVDRLVEDLKAGSVELEARGVFVTKPYRGPDGAVKESRIFRIAQAVIPACNGSPEMAIGFPVRTRPEPTKALVQREDTHAESAHARCFSTGIGQKKP